MVRRVVLTSSIRDGCGLLYRATSAKAVTRQCPPEGFLTRNDGLRYGYEKIFGATEDPGLFKVMEHCLQLYKLVARVPRNAPFALRGLHWANVYSTLNGISRTLTTRYLGINYAVVLLSQLVVSCQDLVVICQDLRIQQTKRVLITWAALEMVDPWMSDWGSVTIRLWWVGSG